MESAGICQPNGYIWYDYDLNHWLEPEKEAARRYVIDLALECAQMGFDELMLEDTFVFMTLRVNSNRGVQRTLPLVAESPERLAIEPLWRRPRRT